LRYDNCINCFEPLDSNTSCMHCGFDNETAKIPIGALPAFTLLHNKYLLGKVLGRGGFGITYIAKDVITNSICAIKEFMPSEYSARDDLELSVFPLSDSKSKFVFEHGKEKFIEEAKTLLKLRNNPAVVNILDYFTQYNTAYLVMEYLDGKDLRKLTRENGGIINSDFAKIIFVTVASSLMEVHRLNILHRDLSPENIIVTKKQRITLIDFGAARNFVSCQNKGMSILLKPGFAPPEQYNANGVQGPWSDVYSLCATFYNIVSGKPLIDALFRYRGEKQPSLYSLGCDVSKKTSDVIEKGMELEYKRRYQDFKQLMDEIDIQYSNRSVAKTPTATQGTLATSKNTGNPELKIVETITPTVSFTSSEGIINKNAVQKNDILKIGRSKFSSNLVLDHDTNISRIHCYVRFDDKKNIFYLSDVSANGTYFEDGRRLEKNREYPVPPGTKFYLASRNNMLFVNVEKG